MPYVCSPEELAQIEKDAAEYAAWRNSLVPVQGPLPEGWAPAGFDRILVMLPGDVGERCEFDGCGGYSAARIDRRGVLSGRSHELDACESCARQCMLPGISQVDPVLLLVDWGL